MVGHLDVIVVADAEQGLRDGYQRGNQKRRAGGETELRRQEIVDDAAIYSHPLKRAHLRDIVMKQYPADILNK